jgi:ribosomal-protein-alanine N-acetyltransferase
MRLETPRLVIRTFEEGDRDAWVAMLQDPEVLRYLPAGPCVTPEMFAGVLERRRTMEREHGYALFAVEEKASGAFLGQCGLYPAEMKGPDPEIAYHYNKAAWGHGYGTEAAIAVLGYAFGTLGIERVLAFVMQGNIGSQRVVEKAGMRFVETGTFYDIPDVLKYLRER